MNILKWQKNLILIIYILKNKKMMIWKLKNHLKLKTQLQILMMMDSKLLKNDNLILCLKNSKFKKKNFYILKMEK